MFFDGDSLKIVDFQVASRGAGATDVAYLVSQGYPLRCHTDTTGSHTRVPCRLADNGVIDYSFDRHQRRYPGFKIAPI